MPHKELAHVPSNLATMRQQILRLFQTVLDASITDVDFSIRVQAYEQAPSLQKFDFQPMKISFEFVGEKQFAEVLYPQSIYDLIDFSLRKCVQEKIMMRTCKNCGKYFALTVHGSTEYCSRVFDSRGRTCKEVGAMRQYVQSHAQDELLKIYRRSTSAASRGSAQGRFRRKHSPLGVRKHRRKRRSARQGKSQKTSLRNGYIGNTQYVENNWFSFNSVLICLYGSLRASFIMVSSKIEDALTLTGGKL